MNIGSITLWSLHCYMISLTEWCDRFWLRATRWCPCFAFSGCLSVKFCQAVCWTSWCGAVHRVEMCDTIPNLSTISTPNKTLIWIHLDSFRSLSGLSGLNGLSLTKEMPGIRQHVRLAAVRRMFIPHMPTLAPVSGTAQGQCKAWPWQLGFDVFFQNQVNWC